MIKKRMTHALLLIQDASRRLDEVQDTTLEASLDGLALAKKLRRTAWGLEKRFEDAATAEMYHTGEPIHAGDDYVAVLRPGSDRKGWKHPEVMKALIETTVETMTERFPYLPESSVQAIVTEAMWTVHRSGRIEWRSTDLRNMGVNPDLFSTKTVESPSIDLRGPGSYDATPRRKRARKSSSEE